MTINLLYARKDLGGGSTSFSVHLYIALKMAGHDVNFYRVVNKPRKTSVFSGYKDVNVLYATPDDLRCIVKTGPMLLTAPERSKDLPDPGLLVDLLKLGMRVVVHDPNEFFHDGHKGSFDHLEEMRRPGLLNGGIRYQSIICIRPTMLSFFPSGRWIPHPYVPEFGVWNGENMRDRLAACSLARVTFVKRSEILLQANEVLDSDRIDLWGRENRLYTYHKVKKQFPSFKQGNTGTPFERGIAARKASEYKLAIDMTYFPNDGGGSQYSFMEAWDGGAVNVIHKDWLRYRGEMKEGFNCLCVRDSDELAATVRATRNPIFNRELKRISCDSHRHLLQTHDPVRIAKMYVKELSK